MKRYETRTEPARERECLVGRVCDLCGREARYRPDDWEARYRPDDWDASRVVIDETTVSWSKGRRDRDGGGEKTTIEVDLCPTCFLEKLVPWLESQGAKVEERRTSW